MPSINCLFTHPQRGANTHVPLLSLIPRAASSSRRHLMRKRDQPCNICRKQSKYITDNLLSNISDRLPGPCPTCSCPGILLQRTSTAGLMHREHAPSEVLCPRGPCLDLPEPVRVPGEPP